MKKLIGYAEEKLKEIRYVIHSAIFVQFLGALPQVAQLIYF